MTPKRKALRIGGGVLGFVGLVWMFQGIGVLQGSPMTGESFWGWAGVVCFIAGAALVYLGVRPGRAPAP